MVECVICGGKATYKFWREIYCSKCVPPWNDTYDEDDIVNEKKS